MVVVGAEAEYLSVEVWKALTAVQSRGALDTPQRGHLAAAEVGHGSQSTSTLMTPLVKGLGPSLPPHLCRHLLRSGDNLLAQGLLGHAGGWTRCASMPSRRRWTWKGNRRARHRRIGGSCRHPLIYDHPTGL